MRKGKGKGIREEELPVQIQTAAKVLRFSAGHATKYVVGSLSPRITEDTSATVPRGKTRNSSRSRQPASKVQSAGTGKGRSFFCVDYGGQIILTCISRIRNGVPTRLHSIHPFAPTMKARNNKRARLLPGATLDALGNDLLIRCASYLDADGLAQLGRASARFGIPQAGQQRSLVNEAAHQRFRQSATDEEIKCLPKHDDESDIELYRALELLRRPLCFVELVGRGFIPQQEHPARLRVPLTGYGRDIWSNGSWSTVIHAGGCSTAMSGHAMRGGRHFVEFTLTKNEGEPLIDLGVIRPVSLTNGIGLEADWGGSVVPVDVSSSWKSAVAEKLRSQRTAKWVDSNINCCTYYCDNGNCNCTDWNNEQDYSDWQRHEELGASGTIGLLLDLDEGTLSVFKNGRRLGVMKDGLGGEYVWFVTVASHCTIHVKK